MPQNLKIADKRQSSFHLPAGSGSFGVYNRTAQNSIRNDGLPKFLSDVHEETGTDVTSAGRQVTSESTHSMRSASTTSRTSLYNNVAAEDPDAIAAGLNLNGVAGLVWKRWAWCATNRP